MFFDSKLLSSFSSIDRTLWIGSRPPVSTFETSIDLKNPALNFREKPENHGRFDRVCLIEAPIGYSNNWQIEIDEAIRTLRIGSNSHLHVRISPVSEVTLAELINHIKSKEEIHVHEASQNAFVDGTVLLSVDLHRPVPQSARTDLDFGVITDGIKKESVKKLIRSIELLNNPNQRKIGIIICGPSNSKEDFVSKSVSIKYLNQPLENSELGWITKKKNLVVSASRAKNIMLVHDRYRVNEDFLNQIDEFGWDFGVVVPSQYTRRRGDFPDWVASQFPWKKGINFQIPVSQYHPNVYINGGAILAKRDILVRNPWEELLMWNQREDVELTRRLQAKGYVPRYASRMTLISDRKELIYRAGFLRVASLPDFGQSEDASKARQPKKWVTNQLSKILHSQATEKFIETRPIKAFKATALGKLLGVAIYKLLHK
jgi:hypothetical protein